MMGVHHAGTGAAAWVALTATSPLITNLNLFGATVPVNLIPSLSLMPLDPLAVAIGAVVTAGAALAPDADHPNATIAYSIPGVGKAVTGAIGAAAGGHRHGTHSGLSAIVVILLAWAITGVLGVVDTEAMSPYVITCGIIAAAMLTFAVKVLRIVRTWGMSWLVGIVAALLITVFIPTQWAWLPWSIAVGWVVHMMGDFLTVGGLPLTWPMNFKPPVTLQHTPVLNRIWMKNGYWSLPILGKTGSMRETALAVPLTLYGFYGIIVSLLLGIPALFS